MNVRRSIRLAFSTLLALAWFWSLLRVAVHPGQAGPVEQGIAAGGWTLSVLPVHAAPRRRAPQLAGPLPTPRGPLPNRSAPYGPPTPATAYGRSAPAGATALSCLPQPTPLPGARDRG